MYIIKNDTKIKLNDKEKDSISSAMNEYKGKNNLREILKYQKNLTFLGGIYGKILKVIRQKKFS